MLYPEDTKATREASKDYTSLDAFYRKVWGAHPHHGLWETGKESVAEATEKLIDRVAALAEIDETCRVLDLDARNGATSKYLAQKKKAHLTSFTSNYSHWKIASSVDPSSINPHYLLGDFLHNTLPSNSFDVILAIESSKHLVDNPLFFKEIARLLKPRGRFIASLCLLGESSSSWGGKHLLKPIEGLLSLKTPEDFTKSLKNVGLAVENCQNLSSKVQKTWPLYTYKTLKEFAVDRQMLSHFLKGHHQPSPRTLARIWAAYATKSIQYTLFKVVSNNKKKLNYFYSIIICFFMI